MKKVSDSWMYHENNRFAYELSLVYTNHNCKLSGASRFFILL